MGIISNKRYGSERALYGIENTVVENCRFEGEEDGESALKESRAITVKKLFFRFEISVMARRRSEIGKLRNDRKLPRGSLVRQGRDNFRQ